VPRIPQVRLAFPDVLGKRRDGALPPTSGRDFPTDVFADAPIQIDQGGVYGNGRAATRGFDQTQDRIEIGSRVRLRRALLERALFERVLWEFTHCTRFYLIRSETSSNSDEDAD